MIGLCRGEEVRGKFMVRCAMGRGTLYLLTGRISVEASGRGTVLELPYGEMSWAVQKGGRALRISWAEQGKSFDLVLRTDDAHGAARKLGSLAAGGAGRKTP